MTKKNCKQANTSKAQDYKTFIHTNNPSPCLQLSGSSLAVTYQQSPSRPHLQTVRDHPLQLLPHSINKVYIRLDRKPDMSNFFLNILNSSKHGDTDMEAGNRSDIELGVMEAGGSRSAHPLNPDSMSAMDPGSIFSYSFPAPNSGTEGGNHAPPLSMQTAIPQPAQFNINGKRSQNDNRVSKVRLVEQRSRIPKMVRLYFLKI